MAAAADGPANTNGLGPVILVQPQAQAVTQGGTVSLAVLAGGSSPLTYQWRRNGEAMGEGTNAVLTITNAQSGQDGSYEVDVRGSEGTTTSSSASLTVYDPLDYLFNTGVCGGTDPIVAIDFQSDQRPIVGILRRSQYTVGAGFARFDPNGRVDPAFNTGAGANTTVSAVAVLPDDRVILGGAFTSISGVGRNRIARVGADGSVDLAFPQGTGPNWEVQALAIQTDGKILITGSFSAVNDQPRGRIARLHPNGELDTSFDAGLGANYAIKAVGLQPDARIILGGGFTEFNGIPCAYLTRLQADGSRDTAFDVGIGPNLDVKTVVVQADGKILLGGAFTEINHVPANRLARLNVDGTLDTTFNSGAGADDYLMALAEQADGKILIGGSFRTYDGHASPHVARLNSDGSWDAGYLVGAGASDLVSVIAIRGQTAYVGGTLNSINGIPRRHIARIYLAPPAPYGPLVNGLPASRSVVAGGSVRFQVLATAHPLPQFQWQHEGTNLPGATNALLLLAALQTNQAGLYTLTVSNRLGTTNLMASLTVTGAPPLLLEQSRSQDLSEGARLALEVTATGAPGPFYQWQRDGADLRGETNASLLFQQVRLDQAGTYSVMISNAFGVLPSAPMALHVKIIPLDPYFKVNLGGFGMVKALVLQPLDQKIIIGGWFNSVNGVPCRSLARLHDDGRLDTTFRTEAGLDTIVWALALQSDQKVLCAGNFPPAGGKPQLGLARYNPDGSVDETFSWSMGIDGTVMAIQIQDDNKIIIGGSFYNLGFPPFHHLLRLNPDGTIDPTFDDGRRVPENVCRIAIQNDHKILVGGYFPLIRLLNDGTLDEGFKLSGAEGWTTQTLDLQPDGKILAGNASIGSMSNTVNFARFNVDGSYDPSYRPDIKPDQVVSSSLLQPDGKLILAGLAGVQDGGRFSQLWRLNPDGHAAASFNSGFKIFGDIGPMVQAADGSILVGGYFSSVDGAARVGLARFYPELSIAYRPTISISPSNQTATLNDDVIITATITRFPADLLQWKHNGQDILGATNQTLTLAHVQAEQAGEYQVVGYHGTDSLTSPVAVLSVKVPDQPATIQTLKCGLTPEGFLWVFKAVAGQKYSAEWSSDLQAWRTLREGTLESVEEELLDETAPNQARRFYRIKLFNP